jgi:hypothetical protein
MWPLGGSFPWSAARRVAEDGFFLGAHTLPVVVLVSVESGGAALQVLAVLPCLSLLAAGHMRRMSESRSEAVVFLVEGFLIASIVTLLPWTAFGFLVAAIPALYFSVGCERWQKVTRWSDLHHDDAGDATVRSDR